MCLLRHLSEFAEYVYKSCNRGPNSLCKNLNEIVKKKINHGSSGEGKKDKGDITRFVEAVSDLVSNLQVRSVSNLRETDY